MNLGFELAADTEFDHGRVASLVKVGSAEQHFCDSGWVGFAYDPSNRVGTLARTSFGSVHNPSFEILKNDIATRLRGSIIQRTTTCYNLMMTSTTVDWTYTAAHMLESHGITPQIANEALADPERITHTPDYNSTSGRTNRVIGYSVSARAVIAVIVLPDETGTTPGSQTAETGERTSKGQETMSNSNAALAARIAEEVQASERAYETEMRDTPARAHTITTRGHARTRTLQVRLNDDELAALEARAAEQGIPVSTLARSILLGTHANDVTTALEDALRHALRPDLLRSA